MLREAPVLHTARLTLRTLVDDDAADIAVLFSDPEAMRYWSTAPWSDADEGKRLIAGDRAGLEAGEAIRFGLVERDASRVLGCCSLHHIDWRNRRAEIGYILRREVWGRGLMHEALTALTGFAFDALSLRRLEADVDPRNVASARSLERLGFLREGLMRGRWLVDGEVSDSAIYGLLADDRTKAAG